MLSDPGMTVQGNLTDESLEEINKTLNISATVEYNKKNRNTKNFLTANKNLVSTNGKTQCQPKLCQQKEDINSFFYSEFI